jgi:hypothetical protein
MKKLVLLVVLASIFPVSAYALGSFIPFGGRVTAVHVPPNVGCWTDLTASPFTILPAGLAPVAPWSKMYGLVNVGLVAPVRNIHKIVII